MVSAPVTGNPWVLAAPRVYSLLKVGELQKAPAHSWFHGLGTSESHGERPCAWGLMFCINCLEMLNHFVLASVFCKGRLMGQWNLPRDLEAWLVRDPASHSLFLLLGHVLHGLLFHPQRPGWSSLLPTPLQ